MAEVLPAEARFLVVDDDPDDRFLLTRALTEAGALLANITEANSGEAALRALQDAEFDAVLTDQRMPGLGGVELLAKLRDSQRRTLRILVTGHNDLRVAVEAVNIGKAHAYVPKSSDLRALMPLLAALLRAQSAEAQRDAAFARALGSLRARLDRGRSGTN
ncbi:MAG TPA: response regulator [Candidatus Thermoplasmatota archaeon]|jgi:serine/threonine-protein kinase|nr:response regulator [Candidatus Thermoplasmatota archaeon]